MVHPLADQARATAHIASALRDAATCYRAEAKEPAAEHVDRALAGMNLWGFHAEWQGQARMLGHFAYLGLTDRAAEVADDIAAAMEALYL